MTCVERDVKPFYSTILAKIAQMLWKWFHVIDWVGTSKLVNMVVCHINAFIATLKLQSNGPLYCSMVIGTLAVAGWAVTFGAARRGLGGLRPAQSRPGCTKCNS